MNKFKIYTIDEAIEEVRKLHDQRKIKPLLVAVYGAGQGVGKSYFCRSACERLHKYRIFDIYITNNEHAENIFQSHIFPSLEYLFYQVGLNYKRPDKTIITLFNKRVSHFIGRIPDINIFLFNPQFIQYTKGDLENLVKLFNVVISNPNSKRKH